MDDVLGAKFYLLDRRSGSLLDSWPADDQSPGSGRPEMEQTETPEHEFCRFHFDPAALAPAPGLLIEKTSKVVMLSGVGRGVTKLPRDAVIVGATKDTVIVRIGRYKFIGLDKDDGSTRFEHVFPKNKSLTREVVTLAGSILEMVSTGEVFERAAADFSEIGRWSFFDEIPLIQPPRFDFPFLVFGRKHLVFGLNKGDYHSHLVSLAYGGLRERYRWDLDTNLFPDCVRIDKYILAAGSGEFIWLDIGKGTAVWRLAKDVGYFPDQFLGGDQFIIAGAAEVKAVSFPGGRAQWTFNPTPEHYFEEIRDEYSLICHGVGIEKLKVGAKTIRFRFVESRQHLNMYK